MEPITLCIEVATNTSSWAWLKDVGLLLGGWFLGLMSSIVIDWHKQRLLVSEFQKAMAIELRHLRFRVALNAFMDASATNSLNRTVVKTIKPALLDPQGVQIDPEGLKAMRTVLEYDDEELTQYCALTDLNTAGKGQARSKESIHFVDSHRINFGKLNVELQEKLFRLIRLIDIYNDSVVFFDKMFDVTFQPGQTVNHDIAKGNIEDRRKALVKPEVEIVELSTDIINMTSKPH